MKYDNTKANLVAIPINGENIARFTQILIRFWTEISTPYNLHEDSISLHHESRDIEGEAVYPVRQILGEEVDILLFFHWCVDEGGAI